MSADDATRALAKRFFDFVEQGDIDGLVACYAPDAEIWHNTDGQIQGQADNAAVLKGFVARIHDRVYGDRRLEVFPGGFVQQHLLSGVRAADGGHVSLAACIVCQVKDGRITRLDEYFDSAGVAAFRNAPEAGPGHDPARA
jgi:ketosteroid isomerase-like protein